MLVSMAAILCLGFSVELKANKQGLYTMTLTQVALFLPREPVLLRLVTLPRQVYQG